MACLERSVTQTTIQMGLDTRRHMWWIVLKVDSEVEFGVAIWNTEGRKREDYAEGNADLRYRLDNTLA